VEANPDRRFRVEIFSGQLEKADVELDDEFRRLDPLLATRARRRSRILGKLDGEASMSGIQTVNGMDQSNFEDAVCDAIEKRIGSRPTAFASATYGVVAIERLTGRDAKVDWDEVAAELARTTGVGVTCVANCDWTFDDQPDEEATYIAFACPNVPADYAHSEYRSLLSGEFDPATAPSQQDFDNLKKARRIVEEHLRELDGRQGMLVAAGQNDRSVGNDIFDAERLKGLGASDREAVAAVLALDFPLASSLVEAPAAPAPGN
jgi:hypothetical protein